MYLRPKAAAYLNKDKEISEPSLLKEAHEVRGQGLTFIGRNFRDLSRFAHHVTALDRLELEISKVNKITVGQDDLIKPALRTVLKSATPLLSLPPMLLLYLSGLNMMAPILNNEQ